LGKERIRELKGNYPPCKIPTGNLFMNEAYFHLLLLAYIFVNWFKPLCQPPDWRATPLQTLFHRIMLMRT